MAKNRNNRKNRKPSPPPKVPPSKPIEETPLTEEQLAAARSEVEQQNSALEATREALVTLREEVVVEGEGLTQRQNDFDERVRGIEESQRQLVADQRALKKEEARLSAQKAGLVSRDRSITEREAEAERGFVERHEKALAPLKAELASLRALRDKEAAELAQKRATAEANLNAKIEADSRKAHTRLEARLEQHRKEQEVLLGKEATAARARMKQERQDFDEQIQREQQERQGQHKNREEELNGRQRDQQAKEQELKAREAKAVLDESLLAAREAALASAIDQEAARRTRELERELKDQKRENESILSHRESLQRNVTTLKEELRQFGDREPGEILAEVEALRRKLEQTEDELHSRPRPEVGEALEELQAEKRGWDSQMNKLRREISALKSQRHTWLLEQADLEQQRDLKEAAERQREALLTECKKLDEDVKRLRSLYENSEEIEARIGVIEEPWFPQEQVRRSVEDEVSELEWLAGIQEQCKAADMLFPERLLQAFHTSLKCAEWSALTVLAGVSGTGKSAMPKLYARFGGLAFLPLAVEPNWDSPQSLMGFFNSVDNRFNAEPLLQAMVQSQIDPNDHELGLRDRMLLVLLDEMNLAHVELYFSDLLSKLESRRGEREGETALEIDLGAGLLPYRVSLGRNILWAGTMNEDATTKSLSDKVLDRSNMLIFPRPQTFTRRDRSELPRGVPLLKRSVWEGWINAAPTLDDKIVTPYKSWLEQVNSKLSVVGRALGHRVWQSVEAYMAAHPRVIDAFSQSSDEARTRALQLAFEDAVVFKVMPKLRGIETSGVAKRECLEPIQKLLADESVGLSLVEDFQHARVVGQGAFMWRSARYLSRER